MSLLQFTLVRLEKEQGPQSENLHLPHLQPSLSDHLLGHHPGRNWERIGLSQLLLQAKAMWLQYYLKTGEGEENEHSKAWMIHFLMKVGSLEQSLALKKIKVPSSWG